MHLKNLFFLYLLFKSHATVKWNIFYFNDINPPISQGEKSENVSFGKHTCILHHKILG